MNQTAKPENKLNPTGLTKHDIDQFKTYFAVSLVKANNQTEAKARQAAIDLLKQKIKPKQVFYEVSENRDGINKLYFLGWVKLLDGSEVAVFQNRHLVVNRANFLRDLRECESAPLTGYYLTREEANAALAGYFARKLETLKADRGCGCGIDHGENETIFEVPGA